mmetsp:Transcript_20103/g.29085  ORF Transcript_20103/g.29085 Transcript_20103/m.29085 type:complete len:216 (+) Transcript_20103:499-1146(+)
MVRRPRLGTMNRPFTEEYDIAGFHDGLSNELFILFSVDHSRGHFEVGFVGSRHHTESTIAGVVICQDDIDAQESCPDGPVGVFVFQKWIVLSGRTIDRSTVQRKALGTLILCDDKGQMVHAVALSQNSVIKRYQPGMGQDTFEDSGIFLPPLQHPPHILPSGSGTIERCTLGGIPECVGLPFDHLIRAFVDDSVGLLDFVLVQDTTNNYESVQVE